MLCPADKRLIPTPTAYGISKIVFLAAKKDFKAPEGFSSGSLITAETRFTGLKRVNKALLLVFLQRLSYNT